jgi:ABC-type amino acid transport substrate-binding protein
LLYEIRGVEIVHAGSQEEMFEWVASGKARALATDSPIAFRLLLEHDGLELGLPLTPEQHFGFAVAKGSPLGVSLSEHIKRLKSSGIYFRLLERYLGAKAVEIIQTARKN